jgi:hypothetical protein
VKISRSRSSGSCRPPHADRRPELPVGRVALDDLAQPLVPANAVDGLVPGRLDDPGSWRVGNAGLGPLHERGGKGFLDGVFGEGEVAHQPDHRGDDAPPVGAVEAVDGLGGLGHVSS